MLHRFAATAATAQHSSGGGCALYLWLLPRSAAVTGAAAQSRSGDLPVMAQHYKIFSMLRQFAAQRLGDLKKCIWEGPRGMRGAGREGEGRLLNSVVVEALAGVCESEP